MTEKIMVSWADGNEEVMDSCNEMVITKDNELLVIADDDRIDKKDNKHFFVQGWSGEEYEIKECVSPYPFPTHHTTDWLRSFCEKHHPEVDFDTDFETHRPGVFARYQDSFGYDYEKWVAEAKRNALNDELSKLGYQLS